MALPKLDYATYDVVVPSTKQTIKYRPYTVKEQKILIQALEFKEETNVINTISGIVDVCTFNKLKLDDLAAFDIEYLFLHIKARSTGDNISVNYICRNKIDSVSENGEPESKECSTKIKTSINLLKAEVVSNKVNDLIKLSDSVAIKLKYPNFGTYRKNINLYSVTELVNVPEVLFDCIEYVLNSEEILKPELDFSREECNDFIEDLSVESVEGIIEFFHNIPTLKYSMKLKCPKCGMEEHIKLDGIDDFLA